MAQGAAVPGGTCGANRRLYEEVLVKAYATWFHDDPLFPLQGEVFALIYDVLVEAPELWRG